MDGQPVVAGLGLALRRSPGFGCRLVGTARCAAPPGGGNLAQGGQLGFSCQLFIESGALLLLRGAVHAATSGCNGAHAQLLYQPTTKCLLQLAFGRTVSPGIAKLL